MTRIATDAGGTFTDLVAYDQASGRVITAKALTTPQDPSQGVLATMRQADGLQAAGAEFFVHGSTTVINAITERKGAVTALVTTAGFRDVLAIGRGNRPDLYNLQAANPEPFVPRRRRYEVTERIDAQGQVLEPLSLDDVDRVAAEIKAAGATAVAVLFLHSYLNPAHEIAAAERLRALLADAVVVASHEVSRQWREYERANTAVLSAYVRATIARYLTNLGIALSGEGVKGAVYAMQSNGGLASFAQAQAQPLTLVESGPAGGVAGAVQIGRIANEADVLYLDVGGTTAKCALVRGGRPELNTEYKLEWTRQFPGYPVQVPVVDIVEIGAGGGSMAWFDAAGSLKVGPVSAGAEPGPACYARGGTAATVTDAKLVAGVIDPENFAGGRMRLDVGLAERALQPVADRLGRNIAGAADAIIQVVEAGMINALKLVTVQRGHDPRDLALVASGGGGPMHAAALGRELGVKRIIVPPYAGLFSAWGMLAALPRLDLRRTLLMPADAAALTAIAEIFAGLQDEAATEMPGAKLRFRPLIEMRYAGQEHTVRVAIELAGLTLASLLEAFHAAHERAYTFRLQETAAELVTFHLEVEQLAPRVDLPRLDPAGRSFEGARRGSRDLLLDNGNAREPATVFDRDLLPIDMAMAGPVLIEEASTTTMVLPGQAARIDPHGLLIIEEA